MSIHLGEVTAAPTASDLSGEVEERLSRLESRRFRGSHWLSADEVTELCLYADNEIKLLRGEIERQRRENREFLQQVEMLRHGILPSTAPKGPDPMVLELAMRAQDEANTMIGEASTEGAEIIAEARDQAAQIIAQARDHASLIIAEAQRSGSGGGAHDGQKVAELQRHLQDLEQRHRALVSVATVAEQQLRRWHESLSGLAEQLNQDAGAVGAISLQLRAATTG